MSGGPAFGRFVLVVFPVQIRAGLEQLSNHFVVPVAGGEHQRRAPVGGECIGIGTLGKQQFDNRRAAFESGIQQRVPAIVVEGGTGLQQLFDDSGVAPQTGQHHCAVTGRIAGIELDAALTDEFGHHFGLLFPGCQNQQGVATLVGGVRVHASGD